MFKSFQGAHVIDSYHKNKAKKRFKMDAYIKAVIAAIVSIIIACLPTESLGIANLDAVQQRVIAIFVFAAVMWLTEAIPSWCTSVLIIVVMLFTISNNCLTPFAGVEGATYVPYKSIMACFADPTILLFIGGFVLAIGMTKTKLDVVLAKKLLAPFGTKPATVLMGFIMVTALFSAFVSNTATAAMMLAFLAPVLRAMPDGSKDRVALAMAIPIGANIGGIATPIGTPPNTIVLGYMNETLGMSVGFGEWMLKMVPFVVILLVAAWMLLRIMFPFQQKEIKLQIEGEFEPTAQTHIVIWTFVVTIFLWCFASVDFSSIGLPQVAWNLGLNSNITALLPVAIFCVTGVFSKHDLEEINWSVLWMVAGGFALGVALNTTKLSSVLVDAIPFAEWSPLLVMVISGLVCFGFSNFISHSAAASLLTPVLGVVAGAMATAGKLDQGGVAQMLIGVAIAASVSMILPISTPPNAIAHSTGFIQQKDMMTVGIIVGILGLVIGYSWMFLVF